MLGDVVVLTVFGMNCSHCTQHVSRAIKTVPGVLGARVDLVERIAVVEFEAGRADRSALKEALLQEGYKAE